MPQYITQEQLAQGYNGFPAIPIPSQKNLRAKNQLTSTKINGAIYYTEAWLKAYADRNTKEAK